MLCNHPIHYAGSHHTLHPSKASNNNSTQYTQQGLGSLEADEEEGLRWLRRASDANNSQAHYELGTLNYCGNYSVVPEDERGAFAFFERAAATGHVGGMFMVADCLLSGVGCERDEARAVPLLYSAAEKGHRTARWRLLQLVDEWEAKRAA